MVCRYLRKFLHESLAPKKQGLGVQNPCPLSLSGHDVAIAEGMHGDRAEVCPLDASAIICLSTVFLIHFCPEFIRFFACFSGLLNHWVFCCHISHNGRK